jgi:hypothetical protein
LVASKYRLAIALVGVLVALATLITTNAAYAAGYGQRYHAPPTAYNAQANPNYGFGPRVSVQPNDVIAGDRIIGRDPDPFIRGEILRHYHSGRH